MWKWGGDEKLDGIYIYIYIYIYIIRKWDRYEMGLAPVAGEFPAQRASNADNVSIWWRHHPSMSCGNYYVCHAFVPLLYQAWCVHSGPTYFTVLLMAFISRTQFGYTLILQLFRHIHPSSKVTGFFFAMSKGSASIQCTYLQFRESHYEVFFDKCSVKITDELR